MTSLESFLARCERYLRLRRERGLRSWSEATLSRRLFNNGGKIAQLRAGKDVLSGTLDQASHELVTLQRQTLSPRRPRPAKADTDTAGAAS